MDVIRYSVQVLLNVSKVTLIFCFSLEADTVVFIYPQKFESKETIFDFLQN